MGWKENPQKLLAAAAVLALHAFLIAFLVRANLATAPSPPEHETILVLTPLPPPPKPAKRKPAAPSVVAAPFQLSRTPPRALAPPPIPQSPDAALQGLGASLGCGASNYDHLDAEQRAACGHGPWTYDHDAKETASLIVKAPRVMSAAERAERIRDTVDPCAAEKLTHQTDCIYKVIYGDKLP
jgi:hypothetical protein